MRRCLSLLAIMLALAVCQGQAPLPADEAVAADGEEKEKEFDAATLATLCKHCFACSLMVLLAQAA